MISSMLQERGFAHLVQICTSAHSHSSSSTAIQRCAKSLVDARAERETLEREWGEEMSRLVNPMCSAIYDMWDRFSSSTWIARSVDGKKWPHEWLKIRPAVLQSLPIKIYWTMLFWSRDCVKMFKRTKEQNIIAHCATH